MASAAYRSGLILLALALPARAEWLPPGDYSDAGRVVRTRRGSIGLFDGYCCSFQHNEELHKALAPHLGELVRVDYTRVEEKKGDVISMGGAPIGRIRKITRLTNDVRVTVRPEKARFAVAEPIRAQVTLKNTGKEAVELSFASGNWSLLRDYDGVRTLESEGEAELPRPYGLPPTRALAPGETLRFAVESAWMVKAGAYEIGFALRRADDVYLPSDPVPIEVFGEEDAAALRAWLPRASPTQRIQIAERLFHLGDRSGVPLVLRLLEAPEGIHGPAPIYRFLWQYGCEEAEKRLLALVARSGNQASAEAFIEGVDRAPRAVAVLDRLLHDRRETFGDISGWCERPRICDITASWLVGYTAGAMTFPNAGTEAERDVAVAAVLKTLHESPQSFSVLGERR